jgi:Zn finger protein HypA/HybF involved in hydrogenase expression
MSDEKEDLKEKVMAASRKPMLEKWYRIYVSLCPQCRLSVNLAARKGKRVNAIKAEQIMTKAMDGLCPACKIKQDQVLDE